MKVRLLYFPTEIYTLIHRPMYKHHRIDPILGSAVDGRFFMAGRTIFPLGAGDSPLSIGPFGTFNESCDSDLGALNPPLAVHFAISAFSPITTVWPRMTPVAPFPDPILLFFVCLEPPTAPPREIGVRCVANGWADLGIDRGKVGSAGKEGTGSAVYGL